MKLSNIHSTHTQIEIGVSEKAVQLDIIHGSKQGGFTICLSPHYWKELTRKAGIALRKTPKTYQMDKIQVFCSTRNTPKTEIHTAGFGECKMDFGLSNDTRLVLAVEGARAWEDYVENTVTFSKSEWDAIKKIARGEKVKLYNDYFFTKRAVENYYLPAYESLKNVFLEGETYILVSIFQLNKEQPFTVQSFDHENKIIWTYKEKGLPIPLPTLSEWASDNVLVIPQKALKERKDPANVISGMTKAELQVINLNPIFNWSRFDLCNNPNY